MNEEEVTKKIKELREEKKLTLQALANLTGLTKGYFSKIEKSEKAPPISTLTKIALALDVDITFFLKENTEKLVDINLSVVRKNEKKIVITKGSLYGYQYESLAYNKTDKNMEPFIITPAFDEKAIFQHEGEEFMYVLEGTHEFTYDGKKYILRKGDSIYFNSNVPHSGRSLGNVRAKILTVMYNYKKKVYPVKL